MAIVDQSPASSIAATLQTPVRVEVGRTPARIALAHDWLVGLRGGELVLDRIAGVIASRHTRGPLYTMFASGGPLTPELARWTTRTSPLAAMPPAARRWLLPAYPAAVASLSRAVARDHRREPIDLVVSTSSAAIKGLRTPRSVPHLCYCHAPARYVWGQHAEYRRTGGPAALGLAVAAPAYRRWDRSTAPRVTRFIANSAYTARQIRACYGREATVVHPPARTGLFTPDPAVTREDFWLAVGALVPYKRFDLAIEAARAAGAPLVIIGDGSDRARLEALADGSVRFLGSVDLATLIDHYRRARLLVFPQVEDFGIAAVEAQACGCPVLARAAGGALDSVIDGVTGALFGDEAGGDDPAEVAKAAARVPSDAEACRRQAERFSEESFDRAIATIIDRTLADQSAR